LLGIGQHWLRGQRPKPQGEIPLKNLVGGEERGEKKEEEKTP